MSKAGDFIAVKTGFANKNFFVVSCVLMTCGIVVTFTQV